MHSNLLKEIRAMDAFETIHMNESGDDGYVSMALDLSGKKAAPLTGDTLDSSKKVKILIVDDLKDNLLALEGLLRRDDVEIFEARSGLEALGLMIPHDFALALVDVQMPGMSGFELAELMRGAKRTQNIPIIFVTATSSDQTFSFKGYESGAVDFLRKPLDTYAVKSKANIFIELYRQKMDLRRHLETITRAQKEQNALLGTLQKTQADLEKAVQIRDEFMSIASHELKTPLTSLKLQAQLRKRNLKKQDPTAFTREELEKMFDSDEKQLNRIARLIDDMLDISRISSGKLSLNLEPFDLCELVSDLVERSSEQFVAAACPVQVEVCEPVVGTWDRFRIEQVVTNLLTNAMRYGEGKAIVVQVTNSSGRAQIAVSDQGRGIADGDRERIFHRFERAVDGNEISGLGLGLYIVKQILEAHQGSIRVKSDLGKGSTFIVDLPLPEQTGADGHAR